MLATCNGQLKTKFGRPGANHVGFGPSRGGRDGKTVGLTLASWVRRHANLARRRRDLLVPQKHAKRLGRFEGDLRTQRAAWRQGRFIWLGSGPEAQQTGRNPTLGSRVTIAGGWSGWPDRQMGVHRGWVVARGGAGADRGPVARGLFAPALRVVVEHLRPSARPRPARGTARRPAPQQRGQPTSEGSPGARCAARTRCA